VTALDPAPRARTSPVGHAWLWAGALAALLFLVPIAIDRPLLDPDEGLHAAIAREMAEGNDWVTPRFLGEPFLDKPILFFWAQAAALRLLGPTDTAVRLVGVVFGLLGATTIGWLTYRVAGARAGWLAAGFHTTMLLPLALAHVAVHDIALVPWATLTVLAGWQAVRAGGGARGLFHAALGGVWVGLAMLTKGLSGVAIAGVALAAWVIWTRRLSGWSVLVGAVVLGVGAALAAPWYLAMEAANPGYLHYFVLERHFLGFSTETQPHGTRPFWYYVPLLLGGALPWILAVPHARTTRTGQLEHRDAIVLGWAWLVGGTAFLSLASSKLVTYLLPVFPAVSLLAATAWDRWLPDGDSPGRLRGLRAATRVAGAALGLALPAALVAGTRLFGIPVPVRTWALSAAAAALGAWLACAPPRQPGRALAAWLVTATAVQAIGLLAVLPAASRVFTARELAAVLGRDGIPSRLWVFDERVGSLVFYLDADLRRGLRPGQLVKIGPDVLLAMRQPPPDTLVAIPAEHLRRLEQRVDLSSTPFTPAGGHRLYTAAAIHDAVRATLSRPDR
jgi:4-amino-4-deoxy-L-arabinose transferase-like glycosyltransferase